MESIQHNILPLMIARIKVRLLIDKYIDKLVSFFLKSNMQGNMIVLFHVCS